jgi:hypothetical protein
MTTEIETTRTELEAAAFRRLVEHLRERTDVQNIDLMNLAGFCRNCLSRWYREAAEEPGHPPDRPGGAGDRLRHAVQGVAGQAPDGSDRRSRRRSSPRATLDTDGGLVCEQGQGRFAPLPSPSYTARPGAPRRRTLSLHCPETP